MSRLFRDHEDYRALGDNQRERIERAQQKWREQNPPPQPDQRIHDRFWDDERLRPRAEREQLARSQERAGSILEFEAERRMGEQPQRPLNWAARMLAEYEGRSGLSPERRKKLEAEAKSIEKRIDAEIAAEAKRQERESKPDYVSVREHSAQILAGLRPEAQHDGQLAVAIADKLLESDSPDWSIYWAQVQVARDKSLAATRAEREALAAERYAATMKHEAATLAEAEQAQALEVERNV